VRREGQYLLDRDPTADVDGTMPELLARIAVGNHPSGSKRTE
jgi:hypothetical protein